MRDTAGKDENNRSRREKAMEKRQSRDNVTQCPSLYGKLTEFIFDLMFGCCKRGLLG